MRRTTFRMYATGLSVLFLVVLFLKMTPGLLAQQGAVRTTPTVPPELPVEVETEMAPGSLKQAPLWKENGAAPEESLHSGRSPSGIRRCDAAA